MAKANDIVKSPEAAIMLGMATKDFYDDAYTALWMFEVIGREYDEMAEWARGLRQEVNPQTCTWSIDIWEWVYGFEPDDSLQPDYRRQRILAHIVGDAPINPEVIRRGVAALTGAKVEVIENTAPYTFEVVISPTGKPLNYIGIWKYIRKIKPSHLAFDALLETRTAIQITIGTRYNLLGYGLTGQYNAGTRPWTNVTAALRDTGVLIGAEGRPSVFDFPLAGTLPGPNILFKQDGMMIDPVLTAAPYQVAYPMTGDDGRAGTHPQPNVAGGISDTGVETDISAQGLVFPFEAAGTKPQPDTRYSADGGGLKPTIQTENYGVAFVMCGTKLTGE